MRNLPKVVVIIPTCNSEKFIKDCLKSVLTQDYQNLEVIVVDNNSGDRTLEIVREFRKVAVIKNNKNYGVCSARNQAIKSTCSEYILALDSDMILTPKYIAKIIHNSENAPCNIGMWGGTILNMRKPEYVDSLGILLTKFYRFYDYGRGRRYNNFQTDLSRVIGPCACAAIYKRKMLESITGASGEYFDSKMHYLIEDFDLAIRAQNKGYKFNYIPEAIGYHYRGGSNLNPKYTQYLSFRNRYFLILKYFRPKDFACLFLSLLFYDLPRLLFLLTTNYAYTKLALKEINKFFRGK